MHFYFRQMPNQFSVQFDFVWLCDLEESHFHDFFGYRIHLNQLNVLLSKALAISILNTQYPIQYVWNAINQLAVFLLLFRFISTWNKPNPTKLMWISVSFDILPLTLVIKEKLCPAINRLLKCQSPINIISMDFFFFFSQIDCIYRGANNVLYV